MRSLFACSPGRAICLAALVLMAACGGREALAAKRVFEMNVEDTRIALVEKQQFHAFAFAGQVPGPLFYVDEGDELEVTVNNLTALPHTIHWHGMFQRGTWKMDGVPDVTQQGIPPGDSFTYKFVAEPSGTFWYHCHVNVNEHVAMRGMFGPFIVRPKKPVAIEKKVTKDFVLMLSDWASKWADKPGFGGVPGDVYDYFTINGRAFPESEPLRIHKGDVVRLRLIGAGEYTHSIHIHGHSFQIAFKDGFPLPSPIMADTVAVGPGERYDLILTADNPGRWMVHDHVDSHTMNGERPMGGVMAVIEYTDIKSDDAWYPWNKRTPKPDFYYQDSLQKGPGVYTNDTFKGQAIQ
jgi:FtsP/CotA-like multicopper oxidase with cupredoxin domain